MAPHCSVGGAYPATHTIIGYQVDIPLLLFLLLMVDKTLRVWCWAVAVSGRLPSITGRIAPLVAL
jgi:hypothetical protein